MALQPKPSEPFTKPPKRLAAAQPSGINLLNIGWLKAFLKSRWFPAIFTYPTLVVFGFIVYILLWGPTSASANLGTSLTWVLWWPLIPVFMFAVGRLWCAICPFATTIDLVQKFAGLGRPVPPFLKRYGIWIIDAVFIFITWSDHVFGIVESPRGSGYLLGLIIVGVTVTGVWFERRAWCRYLCFLGGLSGNYSRSSALELRATPEICATCTTRSCYRGNAETPGCPVFEFPRVMDSSVNCNLCANCIKTCPNDSIRLVPRTPTKELWFIAKPRFEESFLAVVIVGIVLVQNVTMVSFWEPVMEALTGAMLGSRVLAFTAVFLAAMALPFGLVAGASKLSGQARGEDFSRNFARFGYAVIPLDLAGHIAHNLFHLLAEGKSVFYNVAGLFGYYVTGPASLVSTGTIQIMQWVLIGLGTAASVFTAYKIAQRSSNGVYSWRALIPHFAVLVLFGLVNIYLFTLPMSHRV